MRAWEKVYPGLFTPARQDAGGRAAAADVPVAAAAHPVRRPLHLLPHERPHVLLQHGRHVGRRRRGARTDPRHRQGDHVLDGALRVHDRDGQRRAARRGPESAVLARDGVHAGEGAQPARHPDRLPGPSGLREARRAPGAEGTVRDRARAGRRRDRPGPLHLAELLVVEPPGHRGHPRPHDAAHGRQGSPLRRADLPALAAELPAPD